jgi:hypothetical protein
LLSPIAEEFFQFAACVFVMTLVLHVTGRLKNAKLFDRPPHQLIPVVGEATTTSVNYY